MKNNFSYKTTFTNIKVQFVFNVKSYININITNEKKKKKLSNIYHTSSSQKLNCTLNSKCLHIYTCNGMNCKKIRKEEPTGSVSVDPLLFRMWLNLYALTLIAQLQFSISVELSHLPITLAIG